MWKYLEIFKVLYQYEMLLIKSTALSSHSSRRRSKGTFLTNIQLDKSTSESSEVGSVMFFTGKQNNNRNYYLLRHNHMPAVY